MSIEATEARAAANATHPRVTLKDIEEAIQHVAYMTGEEFITRASNTDVRIKSLPAPENARTLTVCMVSLKNGYMVIGRSAPASPENFKPDLGRKLAYEDCVRQIWPLMGFQLKTKLQADS